MSDTQLLEEPKGAEPIPRAVWRVAAVVVFGAFMGTLDTSLVNIGLKTIGSDLHASLDSTQWVGSAYLLALAVSLPICGWLGKRFGMAKLWLGSLAAFTVASALCAVAPTVGWLIALRVLQGLAAGLVVPAGQTILGRVAGPHRLGRVMSTVGIAVIAAPAIGPTVGGVLLEYASWPWLFLMNIPFGIAGLYLGWRILPRDESVERTAFDYVGFLSIAAGLSLVVYGLGEVGSTGSITAASAWIPVATGAVSLAFFVSRSLRTERTILNVRLFAHREFTAASTAVAFSGAALYGAMLLLPLYFQMLHGDGLVKTGLLLVTFGLGGIVAMPISGRLTDRYGGGVVAVGGSLLTVVSTLPFALLDSTASPVLVEVLLFIRGIAIGAASMPAISAAYATVRRDELPDATSFVNILQRVGGAVGAALLAVVIYRGTQHSGSVDAAFQHAFWWLTAASVVATAASGWLWVRQTRVSDLHE